MVYLRDDVALECSIRWPEFRLRSELKRSMPPAETLVAKYSNWP
jgi:hypothetical protein